MTWQEAVQKAEHLKALGRTEVYLDREDDAPWFLAESVEEGGGHRLEICTSVVFRGRHLSSGISFRWFFDIEKREANGQGYYQIATEDCQAVIQKLPHQCKKLFKAILLDNAKKVETKAKEWAAITKQQFADAETLRRIVNL